MLSARAPPCHRLRTTPPDSLSVGLPLLLNLPGYFVFPAVDRPLDGRRVVVAVAAREDAYPSCWVFSDQVHQRIRQSVEDIPSGCISWELVVIKPTFNCAEQ